MSGFLDLPNAAMDQADVILLPLPFEGTVSYGRGTAKGPESVLVASRQVETFDEETGVELDDLSFCWTEDIHPSSDLDPALYHEEVHKAATLAHQHRGLVIGVGGEHSVTAPLVHAAAGSDDLSGITVVHFDAHADLRDTYQGTAHSHACVMRRLLERGAVVLSIGLRSISRAESDHGQDASNWEPYFAHQLHDGGPAEERLIERLANISGKTYLTIDVDCLDASLSPGTGTPEPGGLSWWQAMNYLRAILQPVPESKTVLIGADITETAPMEGTQVNEFTAARLVCKILAYLG